MPALQCLRPLCRDAAPGWAPVLWSCAWDAHEVGQVPPSCWAAVPDSGITVRFLGLWPPLERRSQCCSWGHPEALEFPGPRHQQWSKAQSPGAGITNCQTSVPLPPLCLVDSGFALNKGPAALSTALEELTKDNRFSSTPRGLFAGENIPFLSLQQGRTALQDQSSPETWEQLGSGRRAGSCGMTAAEPQAGSGRAGK